jgi:hypothetical protein
VVNAILVLADVETTLWWGHRRGKDKFDVVKQMFETADLFPIGINAVNRVSGHVTFHLRYLMVGYSLPLAISNLARIY